MEKIKVPQFAAVYIETVKSFPFHNVKILLDGTGDYDNEIDKWLETLTDEEINVLALAYLFGHEVADESN